MAYIFGAMIAGSFLYALCSAGLPELSAGILDSAGAAVQLLISISGMLIMWSGFMRIAKDSGLIEKLSRLFAPLLRRLYPDIAPESDAFRCISMNISANLLGLGNAATPLGLSAIRQMRAQSGSDTATDSMVTFVIMNTASIQLIPTTVAALRKSFGSQQPFDILLCVWLTSAVALTAGLFSSYLIRRASWKRSSRSL
ncbi:MAG: spore maturation protein A [Ruminococcus sp.]|nr:spore maturation protein A [Ruminococcus sp.]